MPCNPMGVKSPSGNRTLTGSSRLPSCFVPSAADSAEVVCEQLARRELVLDRGVRTVGESTGTQRTDPAIVLAIFAGDPYMVVTNGRPLGNAVSPSVNPFMAGEPDEVEFVRPWLDGDSESTRREGVPKNASAHIPSRSSPNRESVR